ncbi:hypothetical protein [Spartinivicinus ruber]|uniref:hypothetical protein n=1 Tax=Spartinivicinus ruber TaxID=2683272 RepID=UPI0013D1DAE7|nr:hypothetical protein [Spartinivicinus ruber]
MGHRANYFLVEENKTSIFYHHWGAKSLPEDFFWGFDASLSYLATLESGEEKLLDDVWCEGAICIKPDIRELILFGGEDLYYDKSLRNVFLSMMSISWAEWRIKWAKKGIIDVIQLSSISPKSVTSNSNTDEDSDDLTQPEADTFNGEWHECLVLIRSENDLITTSKDSAQRVLSIGPGLLDQLSEIPPRSIIREGDDDFPVSQLFIDTTCKTIHIWEEYEELPDRTDLLSKLWTGWQVHSHPGGFYEFCQVAGIPYFEHSRTREEYIKEIRHLVLQDSNFDPEEVLQTIEKHVHDEENFIEKLKSKVVNIFIKKEPKIQVHPSFLQKDKPHLEKKAKMELFSAVIDKFMSDIPDLEIVLSADEDWFKNGLPELIQSPK